MTAAEVHVVTETEIERVEHWRAEELIRAGFDPSDAVALAARHDIDLHFAVELIEQGCPYETAHRDPDLDQPPDAGVRPPGRMSPA